MEREGKTKGGYDEGGSRCGGLPLIRMGSTSSCI